MECPNCKKILEKDESSKLPGDCICENCNRHFSAEFIDGYWRGYHEGRYDGNEEQLERLRAIL